MLKPIAALALATLLTACASSPAGLTLAPSVTDAVKRVGDFTIADLQNADAIAVAAGDSQAHLCYPALITFVQAQQVKAAGLSTQTVSGAFSAFEAARTAVSGAESVISTQDLKTLENSCGPLIVDVQNTPAKFLASLAALGIKP